MWQPNRAQWWVICVTAAIIVLAWPPTQATGIRPQASGSSSLGVKLLHLAVDPRNTLPALPPPLPPGAGDNGELVAAHDEIEAEYYRLYNGSKWNRWRMDLKAAGDPLDPATERQGLVALAVAAALLVWRLSASSSSPSASA